MKKSLQLTIAIFLLSISGAFSQACGEAFTDPAGPNANYANLTDYTVTICPTNPGDVVTVNFTSFSTEAMYDVLYVFDGSTTAAPLISSGNSAGNVPGGMPGGYWGNSIPGPFTSTSPDGCLTFKFLTDGSVTSSGWIANVNCIPPPSCLTPTNLNINSITSNSAVLSWTDNSTVSSWEVLALPQNMSPSPTNSGQVVTTNPATITGLTAATAYSFYVRANCDAGDHSFWSLRANGSSLIPNDECSTAIQVPINGHNCNQVVAGSLNGATASAEPLAPTCLGAADDDAWYKFTATNTNLSISLQNITGSTSNLNFAVYSGSCSALTHIYCATIAGSLSNLTVGSTYYLRVYSSENTPQTSAFNICIAIPSTCSTSESVCGVNNYANTTGVASLGTIGCLSTTPNATFLNVKIASSGPVNLLLTQSTFGSTTANLDVDYAAWGPFTSPTDGCSAISSGQAPGIGVPVTITTGCSYSAAPTENLNIANAQAGEYYVLLVTNFSNQAGYINISQSNASEAGAGSIDCSGIRLNAFLDSNANGTQDSGEPNFPLGQFHYELNNNGNPHSIISPSGSYIIYDPEVSNNYNLSYSINSDYSSQYTAPSGFTNVNTASGSMTVYNFPVTIVQNYNDLGVTIIPQSSPRAGSSYNVKITYINYGTQTIPTGVLNFTNNPGTTITNVSQSGAVATANGFTYTFSNLAPFETRTIIVTIGVPSIPNVSLGQPLTNTVSIVPPSGDVVANNDSSSATQVVIGSYDPNDKIEAHGEKILFSSFTTNDYLEYVIRFENDGTAAALDVTVNDILDNKLDANTLVMLSSSHNYTLDRLGSNLTWTFSNIQLPVSIPDTETGKGYIKFKVKPKVGYAVGDIIPNTASIFFDSNPAIVTNTFNTEFVAALGTGLFTENSIVLYPNPAKSTVFVALQNSTEIIENIAIYDILGKNVNQLSNVSSNQSSIDVSQLSKGIYMVEITTENHLKQIKKLIIQ